jgi:hypothetical protein
MQAMTWTILDYSKIHDKSNPFESLHEIPLWYSLSHLLPHFVCSFQRRLSYLSHRGGTQTGVYKYGLVVLSFLSFYSHLKYHSHSSPDNTSTNKPTWLSVLSPSPFWHSPQQCRPASMPAPAAMQEPVLKLKSSPNPTQPHKVGTCRLIAATDTVAITGATSGLEAVSATPAETWSISLGKSRTDSDTICIRL